MRKIKKGFTLIELLVVISIIGILSALLLTNLFSVRERARDSKRKSDLNEIKNALRLYYNDHQAYPDSNTNYEILGCGDSGITQCPWGGIFGDADSDPLYMKELPLDPSSSDTEVKYRYYQETNTDDFLLVATLENTSDTDAASSQDRCSLYDTYTGTKTATDYVVCAD